jgi:hypothetical protein
MPRTISKILISEQTKKCTYFMTKYVTKEDPKEMNERKEEKQSETTDDDEDDNETDNETTVDEKGEITTIEEVTIPYEIEKRFILVTYKNRPNFSVEYKGEAFWTEDEIANLIQKNPNASIYPSHFESRYRSFL